MIKWWLRSAVGFDHLIGIIEDGSLDSEIEDDEREEELSVVRELSEEVDIEEHRHQ